MRGGSSGYHRMAGRPLAPATPLDASGGPVAPVRFSTPLLWFIGVLVMALTVTAYLLPLPRLQLVDLATSPYLPTRALLLMRACFALAVGTSLRSSLWDPQPVRFNLITYAGTRLAPRSANFQGLERLTTYTVQCWALQLLYFTLAAAASALHLAGGGAVVAGGISLPSALCRAVHILYQLVVQTSLLVTCVVTFVLLPTRLRRGDVVGARRMLGLRPQLMHNANLAFAASELLYNNLPVLPTHFVFGALFGVQYVLLSWWWVRRTGIVYYPFLDPTLPDKQAVAFHVALLSVIAAVLQPLAL